MSSPYIVESSVNKSLSRKAINRGRWGGVGSGRGGRGWVAKVRICVYAAFERSPRSNFVNVAGNAFSLLQDLFSSSVVGVIWKLCNAS